MQIVQQTLASDIFELIIQYDALKVTERFNLLTPDSFRARLVRVSYFDTATNKSLGTYQGRLGTGADARTVEFVQLGRVSLMYRTIDGSETGYWDASKKTWVPDASYKQAVEAAIRVAKRDGAAELLTVPVPAPQEVRS